MPPSQNPSSFSISATGRQTTWRDSPICTVFVVQPLPFTISRGGNFVESRSEEEEGLDLGLPLSAAAAAKAAEPHKSMFVAPGRTHPASSLLRPTAVFTCGRDGKKGKTDVENPPSPFSSSANAKSRSGGSIPACTCEDLSSWPP